MERPVKRTWLGQQPKTNDFLACKNLSSTAGLGKNNHASRNRVSNKAMAGHHALITSTDNEAAATEQGATNYRNGLRLQPKQLQRSSCMEQTATKTGNSNGDLTMSQVRYSL